MNNEINIEEIEKLLSEIHQYETHSIYNPITGVSMKRALDNPHLVVRYSDCTEIIQSLVNRVKELEEVKEVARIYVKNSYRPTPAGDAMRFDGLVKVIKQSEGGE